MKHLTAEEERDLIEKVRSRDKLLDLSIQLEEEERSRRGIEDSIPISLDMLAERADMSVPEIKKVLWEGSKARRTLIERNQGLIWKQIKSYECDQKVDRADLLQEGNIGLIKAIDRFEPQKGRFSTVATQWVRGQLSAYVSQKTRNVRIPQYKTGDMRQVTKGEKALREKLGRTPSTEELSKELGWSEKYIQELEALKNAERSLDARAPGEEGEGSTYESFLSREEHLEFWKKEFQKIRQEAVRDFLKESFPSRKTSNKKDFTLHRRVIEERFGFRDDGRGKSIPEIARKLKMPQAKVRSLYFSSLESLRKRKQHLMWLLGDKV